MMKWNFTYKELSLLVGIVVALIIVLTFWLKPVSGDSKNVSLKAIPKTGITITHAFLKEAFKTYASLR